jgi:phosphatidylglycerophosphatase A
VFKFLSTAFWASYILPPAPGTAGMLVGVGLWYLLGKLRLVPFLHFMILFVLAGAGVYICDRAALYWGSSDATFMSYDSMVGFMIAAAPFRPGFDPKWTHMLGLLMVVYWFLSVIQPFPINQCREWPGGLKYMGDDLLAALATIFLTWGLYQPLWKGLLGLG